MNDEVVDLSVFRFAYTWGVLAALLSVAGTVLWLSVTLAAQESWSEPGVALTMTTLGLITALYKHTQKALSRPRRDAKPLVIHTDADIVRKHLRILFVDDERPEAAQLLQDQGYNVRTVLDVDQALMSEIHSLEYHVVFLDIRGVGHHFNGDGLGILKEIKRLGPLPRVAIYSAQPWPPGEAKTEEMFELSDARADKQRPETFGDLVRDLGQTVFHHDAVREEIEFADKGVEVSGDFEGLLTSINRIDSRRRPGVHELLGVATIFDLS